MHIAVAATPAVALPTLDWLTTSEHQLTLVITQPDRPSGRGQKVKESHVSSWAAAHSLPCIKPRKSDELAAPLHNIDLVITIGYGVILPVRILSIPRFGFINLHFSLLPAWRGAAPVQRAILNGDPRVGLTVFALDAGMDTGPIYIQREIANVPDENAGARLQRMAAIAPELIRDSIELIGRGAPPVKQVEKGVSYAPKVTKEDARIHWNGESIEIARHIRAFTPEPGAWTTWRDVPLRITKAHPYRDQSRLEKGQIAVEKGDVIVGSGHGGAILVEEVTPAGKRSMSAKSWINGARPLPGEFFV